MDDILLMQLLKKKGIISEGDIHELHQLTSPSITGEPIYLSSTDHKQYVQDSSYINESDAKDIVSKMFHFESGRKYIGEKFDMYRAKEICERYKGLIPSNISACVVYIAINSQYHDYIELFKNWFTDNLEQKIIESAIVFWFKDADCLKQHKVIKYFFEH